MISEKYVHFSTHKMGNGQIQKCPSFRAFWHTVRTITPSGSFIVNYYKRTFGTNCHPSRWVGPRPDGGMQRRLSVPFPFFSSSCFSFHVMYVLFTPFSSSLAFSVRWTPTHVFAVHGDPCRWECVSWQLRDLFVSLSSPSATVRLALRGTLNTYFGKHSL